MKKTNYILVLILAVVGIIGSCKQSFLDVKPAGALDQNILATPSGVEAMVVGVYACLDGQGGPGGWGSATTNWVYGSIRGLEANKGSDAGDQPYINPIQTFSETATNDYLNVKWRTVYDAIARCNSAIAVINLAQTNGTITREQATTYLQQVKALRGWYHFDAWRMWKKIPYMDETTDAATVTNTEDVTAKIIADLTEGTNLAVNMGAVGKFNKTVCQIILAKAKMEMQGDYAGALTLLNDAKTSGKKPNGANIGLAELMAKYLILLTVMALKLSIQYSILLMIIQAEQTAETAKY